MTARVHKTEAPKRREFRPSALLDEIAERFELAFRPVGGELKREAERRRTMEEAARAQLMEKGLPILEATRSAFAIEVEDVTLGRKPREVLAQIRSLAADVRSSEKDRASWIGAIKPIRIARKAARKGERLRVEPTIAAHIRWAVEQGADDPERYRITLETPIEGVSSTHLHLRNSYSAQCIANPCKRLAVCRNLVELMDARQTDLKTSTRNLSQVAFDAAAELNAIARHFESSGAPAEVVARMQRLSTSLYAMEEDLRRLLTAPADHAPRGTRPPQPTLHSVTQQLHIAEFDDHEASALIDDGTPTGKVRLKNYRRRIDRYFEALREGKLTDWRTEWISGSSCPPGDDSGGHKQ